MRDIDSAAFKVRNRWSRLCRACRFTLARPRVYNNTHGSLLIASPLHASFNTTENSLKLLMPSLAETSRPTILFGLLTLASAVLPVVTVGPALQTRSRHAIHGLLDGAGPAKTKKSL